MKPKWLETFEEAVHAGTRAVILVFNTTDRVHCPELGPTASLKFFLASHLQSQGYAVAGYSVASGLQELQRPDSRRADGFPFAGVPRGREPERVLPALTPLLRNPERKLAVVLDYADHLAPSSQGMGAVLSPGQQMALQLLHGWGTDDAIRATHNLIILISHENQVNDLLRRAGSGYRVIQVDLPSEGERRQFVQLLTDLSDEGRNREFGALAEELSADELARITGGLRLADVEALFRLAAAKGESISRHMVADRKADAIKELCRDLVEVHEPGHGFEAVAGLRHAVEYLQDLKWRIHSGAEDVPQAILLAGVPGSGKSFLVLALAKELGYPCLAMRNVRDKWVGASERNLELVLWVAQTLAPCMIWIDELDQALGQRATGASGDSGTSERMLSRIWEFVGSMKHRGRILWLATTNRPDLLDPATLDRFPVVIPFLHPTPSEVEALLPVLAHQLGRELAEDVQPEAIARLPSLQLPTVRTLQEVVAMAGAWADRDADQPGAYISQAHLEEAAIDFKPNYSVLEHEFIGLTAVRMTSFQSLLPWRSRGGRRRDVELPRYLEGLVDGEGMVDIQRLGERLRALRSMM
jgi:transitional endoplasmic reticulum ATPase